MQIINPKAKNKITDQCLEVGVPKVPGVPEINNNRVNQFLL
jgi:hypothetical protein